MLTLRKELESTNFYDYSRTRRIKATAKYI